MDEDTKCSLLKRAFPPGLEDQVTSIETKVARIAGISICLCQVKLVNITPWPLSQPGIKIKTTHTTIN